MMKFVHIGLSCGSEENSDAFYGTLLGLEKKGSKTLPSELSGQIFNVDTDYTIIDYAGSGLHFEIFIDPNISLNRPNLAHVCLEVGDLRTFLQKAETMGFNVRRIPKGDRFLTFVEDFDGNLFEIKEKQSGS